jgi:hypothetical protein
VIGSDIDMRVREAPTGAKIAGLVASHGWDAAVERWYWLDQRTLSDHVKAYERGIRRGSLDRPARVYRNKTVAKSL